jgi:homogentisate 1,2-dioxygenase
VAVPVAALAQHPAYKPFAQGLVRTGPFHEAPPSPNRMRWDPLPLPTAPTDWVEGLTTYGGTGDAEALSGIGIHLYAANRSMVDRVFYCADGELLIVPQEGDQAFVTEMGRIDARPGEIVVIPRGVRFRVECSGPIRGYVCENYGALFRLPELGPIGSNGLANPRAISRRPWRPSRTSTADRVRAEIRRAAVDHDLRIRRSMWSAWHGNYAPYKYDTPGSTRSARSASTTRTRRSSPS